MPVKTAAKQAITEADTWRVSYWTVDHRGTGDRIICLIEAGLADAQGNVTLWQTVSTKQVEGAALSAVMADVGNRIKVKMDAGTVAALAVRDGIKEALYAHFQSTGDLPAGTVT